MPRLPLKDFFDSLCSLKNAAGWVQEPGGRALIKYLAEKAIISPVAVTRKLDELAELGYIEKEFRGHQKEILWRIKILIDTWDETRLTEKLERERIALEVTRTSERTAKEAVAEASTNAKPESVKTTTERRFAIFMDYSNLEKNLPRNTDRFRDFSWLLDPILRQGKLIVSFVFIPDHYVSRAPIMQLTHKHHFHAIFCPRQIGKSITKDADTVDSQLQDLAWTIIQECGDITDIVIVSGDADFQRLATHARWQQKLVTVVSTERAVSGRFLEMAQDGSLAVQLVS